MVIRVLETLPRFPHFWSAAEQPEVHIFPARDDCQRHGNQPGVRVVVDRGDSQFICRLCADEKLAFYRHVWKRLTNADTETKERRARRHTPPGVKPHT